MLYKFSSKNCGPCKKLDEYLASKNLPVETISIDDRSEIVDNAISSYGIRSVPTLYNTDTGEKVVGLEPIISYLKMHYE